MLRRPGFPSLSWVDRAASPSVFLKDFLADADQTYRPLPCGKSTDENKKGGGIT